jgi:glycosyltransferase involved in cell wall biosynthesis
MLGLPDRRIVLIFGFIRRGKGIDVAIKAMKQIRDSLPNTIMLIAGSPQDKDGTIYLQELLKLTTRLSLDDHVRFDTEFIPEGRVPIYFSAASAILVPYTESVGASGPIHNYVGYGIPIVAADVGYHMRESIDGNVLLFKTGDSKSLAKRLVEILRNDNLVTRLGQSQVSYAQRETWRLAANRTVEYYKRVLKI